MIDVHLNIRETEIYVLTLRRYEADRRDGIIFSFQRENTSGKVWWTIFIVLMVATVAVRFYKLHYPEQVW